MRFRKLTLLMWKNYRWRRHFWVWTLIEALVPVFIAIYIPYVILLKPNSWAKSTVTKYQSSFNPTNNKTFILYKTVLTNVLAYTPWNPSNQQIVENVVNILNGLSIEDYENTKKTMTVKNFSSENDLESFMFNRTACGTCIGIVFEQSSHDVFRYKLRLNDFTKTLGSRVLREKPAPAQHDVYVERGFAGIQLLLNEEFIRMQINKTDWHPPEFHPAFLEFPVPEYETSTIPRNGFITIASLSIIITSVALSIPFINAVIQEKETGVMELMKIHGVEEWMIWLSWLIHAFIVPAISLTLMTLVFKTSALSNGIELVRYVSFPALWLLFMMYSLANISFICLFCAIFHKGIVASFTFIVVLIANFLWIAFYHELNLQSTAIFIALIPASAFAIAIETVQKYELLGESFGLTSFGSIFYSVGMLLFDIVLYSLLTLYITSINPGTHGVPKKPLFFLESLLKKDEKKKESTNELQILTGTQINYNESSSSQLRPLITIKNLTKQYGSSYAISAVDLVIYENEIIAVLGHNGAGKTALLTSIAGLSSYDEGTLFYRGAELKDNLDTLRTNLGICFQEDRLFDYLSVADHLKFYAMLKGLSKKDATHAAVQNMKMLEMRGKENSKANTLTISSRRKLSFAIALLKKPKILILDEATFGMDFISKRRAWSMLKNLRKDHTIILSTGYAKEAARLADRVAILQNGTVVTHGTPAYLENTFGTGYELIITIEKNTNHVPLLELVKKVISDALVTQQKYNVIAFKIPPAEIIKFVQVFKELEQNKKSLGIINMEVAYATLEQILSKIQNEFLETPKRLSKIIHDKITPKNRSNDQNVTYSTNLPSAKPSPTLGDSNFQVEKGFSLKVQQMRVLLEVKILYTKRSYLNVIVKLGLPSLLLAVVLLTASKIKPKSEVLLSLEEFQNPTILLQKTKTNVALYEIISKYIEEREGMVIPFSENINEKLLEIAKYDKILFGTSLLAAFEFETSVTTIVYNQWELKSLPLAINIYSNTLLKYQIRNTSWKIENVNKPMPDSNESYCGKVSEETYKLAITTLLFVFFAFYTVDLILYFFEFASMKLARKLLHVQTVSGVPFWLHWLSTLVFDFSFFIIVVIIRLMIVMFLSDVSLNFTPLSDFHGAFMVMMALFGISGLLCTYTMSFLFKTTKSMYASFLVLNALCSISMYIFNRIEESILTDYAQFVSFGLFYYPLKYIILFIPFLNFTLLFNKFLEIWKHNSACDSCQPFLKSSCEGNLQKLSFWSFPSSGNPNGLSLGLLFLFIDIILYAVLLSLINMGYIDRWFNSLTSFLLRHSDDGQDDEYDVKQERFEIENIKKDKSKYNKTSLIADGLSKNYFTSIKPTTAIENISFIAQRGTCFGILGVNGAGKSTILKILAGKICPSKGNVSIEGVELNTRKSEYFSMIGYCPQTSPLFDEFTGKEMLEIFGLLSGIRKKDIETITDKWISDFELEKIQDKICKIHSHTNKRKLSIAISLIGDPKVVILDEPTCGIDSDGKNKFYEIMSKHRESGKTIIFCSTSMDECQKLCDRITIIINGEMHCIGTVAHLKKKFAVGFSVSIRIRRSGSSSKDVVLLEQNILNVFGHRYCFLKEEHRDLLYYHIKDPSLSWSTVFERMENIKRNNAIVEDYILRNISLKEIFTAFTQPEQTSSKSTYRESI